MHEPTTEELIQQCMQDRLFKQIARCMFQSIKDACSDAQKHYTNRIYGHVAGFMTRKFASDDEYRPSAKFYDYHGVRPRMVEKLGNWDWERDEHNLRRPNSIYRYGIPRYTTTTYIHQQAFIRMLTPMLEEDGFPKGCIRPVTHTYILQLFNKVSRPILGNCYSNEEIVDYRIEVDISW